MLSIILYGRNDAHGYNLHKRAALSLNCIAHVLTGPADEIVFVDYNTPDELPTFPEAIADTLTEACKARLRILRVRPDFHRQFEGRTGVQVLECQSRNIAIRRANPANRWVLSTNTDMIFCPARGDSLTDIVAGLDDGYYHLPRFETPEGFWERLPRQDAPGAIAAMQERGRRYHLNEIVYGSYDNLYEAPGDFQLFLREDLERIAGFDERMILGWHADGNIARRMKLLRGEVNTVFGDLSGYHCGHTRQATALHKGVRTENSQLTYIRDVSEPEAPGQGETWGYPHVAFEEIRLDGPDRYFSALSRAIPAPGPAYSEATQGVATFAPEAYDGAPYQADHVLPHLCDLMFNLPPGQTILFLGDDDALASGLAAFLEAAGKRSRIRRPDAGEALDDAFVTADIFVLQYPSPDKGPPEARAAAAWRCRQALQRIAELERERPAGERRRVVVVNSFHNGVSQEVEALLAPTSAPFSTRLRQGFVGDLPAPAARAWSDDERVLLGGLLNALAAGQPPKDWERLALQLRDIAAAASSAAAFGLDADKAGEVLALCDAAIAKAAAAVAEAPVEIMARPDAATRLCSSTDWLDPQWARLAKSSFHLDHVRLSDQTRWVWARLGLAREVSRALPLGRRSRPPRILLVAAGPDMLGPLLLRLGYDVTYAATDDVLANAAPSAEWAGLMAQAGADLPPHHRPLDARADSTPFAAIVLLMPAWVEKGAANVEALLSALAPFANAQTALIAAATVQLNRVEYEGGFTWAEWNTLFAPTGPLGRRGFTPLGEVDTRIPLDTVVRFAFEDAPSEVVPGLSYGFLEGFNTAALICARWPARLQA